MFIEANTTDSARSIEQPAIPTYYLVADAHLDTQWLWNIQTTLRECIPNTLQRNFALFEQFLHYTFSFEGAFRYALIKEYYPLEYARLKEYVGAGRWRLAGSTWDAGDVNIPSPESLIRHTLYGSQFFKQEFGQSSCDYFLPDCFGFGYAFPSVAAHCGIKGFSTQKLSWGSAVEVPFAFGNWVGPDGGHIVAVLKPGDYNSKITEDPTQALDWTDGANELGKQCGAYVAYRYFGTGDQGGAPDEASVALLEQAVMLDANHVRILNTGSDQFFRDLTPEQIARMPEYRGELLLSTHGVGCYTTHAEMKRLNRANEKLGDAAERTAVLADWLGGARYPKEKLTASWQRFLWHQFHDDLTGTSQPWVYPFSWNDEFIALNQFAEVFAHGAAVVASAMDTRVEGIPLLIVNPLSIEREDIATAQVAFAGGVPHAVRVFDAAGYEVPAQIGATTGNLTDVIFLAKLPAHGYAVYDIRSSARPCVIETGLSVTHDSLENARYRVLIDDHGDISSIVDKVNQRELLSAPARIALLDDQPDDWLAWEFSYASIAAEPKAYLHDPVVIKVIEDGPARVTLEIDRRYNDTTTFAHRISLASGDAGNRVEVDVSVDWQAYGTIAKATFPMAASNPLAVYDLGLGTITRGNNTPKQYEVPAQQWADLADQDGSYGVAVLSDGMYGWDKPDDHTLRLTLLRNPVDEYLYTRTNDIGKHAMRYAIVGHAGDWRQGQVVWEAARLNQPLVPFQTTPHQGQLDAVFSFMQVSTPQVAAQALKLAEESNEVLIRLQEVTGQPAEDVVISSASIILSARELNGIEEPLGPAIVEQGKLIVSMGAYQPRTIALTLASSGICIAAPTCQAIDLPFNVNVMSFHHESDGGKLDEEGNSIAAELFPATITTEDITFKLGSGGEEQLNAVACRQLTIALPATNGNRLYLLATSRMGDRDAVFTLGDQSVKLTIQDNNEHIGQWENRLINERHISSLLHLKPAYLKRQPIGWLGTHRHDLQGKDDYYRFTYLFKYGIDVPEGATSITLPDDENVLIFAMTLVQTEYDATVPAGYLYSKPWQDPLVSLYEPPMHEAIMPSDTCPGLAYHLYEGECRKVAEFSTNNAQVYPLVETGSSSNFTVASHRGGHFIVSYTGFLAVAADGMYAFYMDSSHYGGKISIDGQEIMFHNFGQGVVEVSSDPILLQAGLHEIAVLYFANDEAKPLSMSYEGPGIPKQPIPETALCYQAGLR